MHDKVEIDNFISTEDKETAINNSLKDYFVKVGKPTLLLYLIVATVLISVVAIPISIPKTRNSRYERLNQMMVTFDIYNYRLIGPLIEKLPSDYRDMDIISTQYKTIMNDINRVEEVNFNRWYDYSTEQYQDAQDSYFNLIDFDDATDNWDLSNYLEEIDVRVALINREWSSEYLIFEYYQEGLGEDLLLQTNLPNNKDSEESYYYTVSSNGTMWGYQNKNDNKDSFDAFRIISVSESELVIYCYSNDENYALSD